MDFCFQCSILLRNIFIHLDAPQLPTEIQSDRFNEAGLIGLSQVFNKSSLSALVISGHTGPNLMCMFPLPPPPFSAPLTSPFIFSSPVLMSPLSSPIFLPPCLHPLFSPSFLFKRLTPFPTSSHQKIMILRCSQVLLFISCNSFLFLLFFRMFLAISF